MPTGASLADWLVRLESVNSKEIVLGLERMHAVLERLPDERPDLVLHVAGTNGKGSSVAMLNALLMESGRTVGAYTSPHLVRYNERIAVNGEPASDAEIVAAFDAIDAARGDLPLTYFEFGTLAAWLVFIERGVNAAVLEIGLGGRLDAVNAIEADAGLITSIALDHQDWLGDTLDDIAREKAGIMRAGKPVVYSAPERPGAIDEVAAATGAVLLAADRDFSVRPDADGWRWQGQRQNLDNLRLPALPGDFQLANAGGVLTLLEAVGVSLDGDTVSRVLENLAVPGRLQRHEDSHRWLFDVAHNPAAAAALASALGAARTGKRVAMIGALDTKDVDGIVEALEDVVDEWIAVTARSPRALDAAELGRRIANALNRHCQVVDDLESGVGEARRLAGTAGEIVVFGSFNTVGPVQEVLGL